VNAGKETHVHTLATAVGGSPNDLVILCRTPSVNVEGKVTIIKVWHCQDAEMGVQRGRLMN